MIVLLKYSKITVRHQGNWANDYALNQKKMRFNFFKTKKTPDKF